MTVSCCDFSVMKTEVGRTANGSSKDENRPLEDNLENRKPRKRFISRRSFLGKSLAVGAGFFINTRTARASGSITAGDAALLRFAAAAEILETDFWGQYNELGGI